MVEDGDARGTEHPPFEDSAGASPRLWGQQACAPWDAARAAYARAVEGRGGARLLAADAWYHTELAPAVQARTPRHLTRDELLQVVRWKMRRGVWRANNLQLAASNPEETIAAATAEALAAVPHPTTPIRAIARLRGVGPATASAVLAAVHPEQYPFLEDVVAAQVPDLGPPAFTLRYYGAYADALRARALRLSRECPAGAWTPHALDLALWTASELGL